MSATLDDAALWVAWLALTAGRYGHGVSAMNAARIALGGEDSGDRPCDEDDWDRCDAMLEGAPESVRKLLWPVLAEWERDAREGARWWAPRPQRRSSR